MTNSELAAFLEDISQCFVTSDFALWRSRTRNPLCLILPRENKFFRSDAELLQNFQECSAVMRIRSVDKIIRRALSHEESDDGSILATYETHVFSAGHRVVEPYESAVIMQRASDGIRACSILNALGASLSFEGTPVRPWASNQTHIPPERSRYLN